MKDCKLLVIAWLAAGTAHAGSPATGELSGHVFDQAGSPIQGVMITAVRKLPETLLKKSYTNQEGAFRLAGLPPGLYDVTASAPKLKKLVKHDVAIAAGPNVALDLIMEVANVIEQVQIVEKAPPVRDTRSSAKESFQFESVQSVARGVTVDGFSAGINGASVDDVAVLAQGWRFIPGFDTERYAHITDNPFLGSRENPLSTFSIDVDTASYANLRRFLRKGVAPPADAVRIEEMVNYFPYNYPATGPDPLSVTFEVNDCPWNRETRLVRIGLRGRELAAQARPDSNLVFLIDVSGSMGDEDKLPLVKQSLRLLVDTLGPRDRVALVVYAGASGLVLPSTPASDRGVIVDAIERLQSGGSTNGAQGIELAYQIAVGSFIRGGNNRVLLATDGDFNVGVTSPGGLIRLIERKAESGVFLTTLGFGTGNLQDATMESLADHGNGNYAYIDSIEEARKVLSEQVTSTLHTVAKDVKLQVEFNPARVVAYRLIGYENRMLRKEDFNDDRKDAGELGAGETVTALYEIVPATVRRAVVWDGAEVDPLRYQRAAQPVGDSPDLLTVKARYKLPDGWFSKKREWTVQDGGAHLHQASTDFRFAAAVAAFGMILRDSPHRGTANHDLVLELAGNGLGQDPHGYRRGFLELVRRR